MPSERRNTNSGVSDLNTDLFLRSINIAFDANSPERVGHFRPTSKCVPLIRALMGIENERSFFLVAPYGSGKSLTAAYGQHLVENSKASGAVRLEINKRLQLVSPELAELAQKRRISSSKKGLALTLHGHVENVAEQLKVAACDSLRRIGLKRWGALSSLKTNDVTVVLTKIREICQKDNCDLVTIIWDEFGRHIEALVAQGRGDQLSEIQTIAEYASRSKRNLLTFCAILHQGLLHYASGLPQAIRSDWKKIEGRFETIQYFDDSKEIYRLIAEVATARRLASGDGQSFRAAQKQCHEVGLFSEFEAGELVDLLKAAYPLEPAALYLLPRVSARVAQNERTLFSFLYNSKLNNRVSVADLYDFFSPAMRSDTAVGGTHRQWLETESAISKLPYEDEGIAILKAACLLGLGTSGERSKTSHALLVFSGRGYSGVSSTKVFNQLVDRNLLLHRKHNDDVSVWHGTDLDLRGRLGDERAKLVPNFNLISFLTKEALPPIWKPVQHNDKNCIRRYLSGAYLSKSSVECIHSWAITEISPDSDGRIVYLLTDNQDELNEARKTAQQLKEDERLFVAIPAAPLPLYDAAIEVTALQRMQLDQELIESDPIALAELQQMTDDAFEHLQKLVDRLVNPSSNGVCWYYLGEPFRAANARELREWLSQKMDSVFFKTPKINNEMINRKKPSAALVNSRKKLTLAILERYGREQLGIEGYFPDKSMFNTVLLHTSMYRNSRSDRWANASPGQMKSISIGSASMPSKAGNCSCRQLPSTIAARERNGAVLAGLNLVNQMETM